MTGTIKVPIASKKPASRGKPLPATQGWRSSSGCWVCGEVIGPEPQPLDDAVFDGAFKQFPLSRHPSERRPGAADDALEVDAGQPAARDRPDLRKHKQAAVTDLLVAVPLRPRLAPRRSARRVEIVGHQLGACRPGEVGGRAPAESLDQLGGFGDGVPA